MGIYGTLSVLSDPNETIRNELNDEKLSENRRQVVAIILLSPDRKKGGGKNGRVGPKKEKKVLFVRSKNNEWGITPPQGGIEKNELLFDAAKRVIRQKLDISIGSLSYVGGFLREFEEERKGFAEYRYHFVVAKASDESFITAPEICDAKWKPVRSINSWAFKEMSPDKAFMTKEVFEQINAKKNSSHCKLRTKMPNVPEVSLAI